MVFALLAEGVAYTGVYYINDTPMNISEKEIMY